MRAALLSACCAWVVPALLGAWLPRQAARADEDCKGPSPDCVAVGRWNVSVALGAGVRTNPLADGEDIPLVVVPEISYYGKRFFLDNLDLGFTVAEYGSNSLSLIATPGYDRVYFYRTDLQNFFLTSSPASSLGQIVNDMRPTYTTDASLAKSLGAPQVPSHPRRITYLAGPEWTFKAGDLTGQFDYLHEITGQNHGDEIRAAVGRPLWRAKGVLSADAGFTWKSSDIVDYYYGVGDIYQGRSSFDPFIKLGYTLPLSRKWRFNAFAQYERLGSGISDSPLVAEHSVETVFVGAVYTF